MVFRGLTRSLDVYTVALRVKAESEMLALKLWRRSLDESGRNQGKMCGQCIEGECRDLMMGTQTNIPGYVLSHTHSSLVASYFCKLFFNFYFFRFYLFIFRERGREGEREGEEYQRVVASHVAPTGDLASNAGMCHDWE